MEALSTDIEFAIIYIFIYFDELYNASFFLNLLFFINNNMKIYLCERVLKYLEQSTKWVENKSGYDDFILLNFCLYDKISRYFVHDTDCIDIAFACIQRIWSNLLNDSYESSYCNKYKPLLKKILNHNYWKKGKEPYYYCINYKLIAPTCTFYDKIFTKYCEYIENKSNIYDHFDKKSKGYNPKVVLNTLKCHERIKAERSTTFEASAAHYPSVQEKYFGVGALGSETSDIGTKFGHSVLGYTRIGAWIRNLGGTSTNSIGCMLGKETAGFLANPQESGDILFDNIGNYISYKPT
ncbi:PIR Superfamily Protein [Plasmodium ovale curtisi]|uniref:PIR Superfamily Protein n=1 Tax=Plasmodium ovale curtisi TaxID=864141 RepID=A0A1A8VS56_PLAOA|nr:PIR Superfamily Protein [Plasmodium ovale curtisi]